MKQTPFYEIEMALKGRPRIFRVVVIAALHVSFLVLLQSAAERWLSDAAIKSLTAEKKAVDHLLSAKHLNTNSK